MILMSQCSDYTLRGAQVLQGGEDPYDALSLDVIFRKRALHLVALLWKMICNLGDPMSLRHPVHMSLMSQHSEVHTGAHSSQLSRPSCTSLTTPCAECV